MCALMKIALTQQETAWEDPAANMRACARLAEDAARAGAALVVGQVAEAEPAVERGVTGHVQEGGEGDAPAAVGP